VPVVSPLAPGPLNVNADEAAAALAVGIGAAKIRFLTDVPGVFHDGELVQSITAARAETLVDAGSFEGGIVPKVLAAARAARGGLVAETRRLAITAEHALEQALLPTYRRRASFVDGGVWRPTTSAAAISISPPASRLSRRPASSVLAAIGS
jgi:acetylglutamate kinase